jgi:hypothetical protein
MTANQKAATASRSKTSSRISLFGPPPLLDGNDPKAYVRAANHFRSSLRKYARRCRLLP